MLYDCIYIKQFLYISRWLSRVYLDTAPSFVRFFFTYYMLLCLDIVEQDYRIIVIRMFLYYANEKFTNEAIYAYFQHLHS